MTSNENAPNTPAAGASSLTPGKGYKWITREIAQLDPEVDYARIWALSTIYYADDRIAQTTRWPTFGAGSNMVPNI